MALASFSSRRPQPSRMQRSTGFGFRFIFPTFREQGRSLSPPAPAMPPPPPRASAPSLMVGLAPEDRETAVDLLREHQPRQPVGEGEAGEREHEIGPLDDLSGVPLRTADEEGEIAAAVHRLAQHPLGEAARIELRAA